MGRSSLEWLCFFIAVDLALAILSVFVNARHLSAPSSKTSVPTVSRDANPLSEPVCCDNFA